MRHRALAHAALSVALFAAAAGVAHRIRVAGERPYDVAFVPSAVGLRWLSLGHPTLAANLTWLRAVQYVGEKRADERGWDKLRPLVEVVTNLDPRHGYAYQVGANMLSSAGRVGDANAILEKGIRAVPDRYILPFHRAVNTFYLYEGDHRLAGRYFELAARTPGAPAHLREYVLAQYVKGDAADAGDLVPAAARGRGRGRRVAAVDPEPNPARDARARRGGARARRGGVPGARRRPANRPRAARRRRARARNPPDPFGGVYYLGADGRVRSTVDPRRFNRPPAGPGREAATAEAWKRLKTLEDSAR